LTLARRSRIGCARQTLDPVRDEACPRNREKLRSA